MTKANCLRQLDQDYLSVKGNLEASNMYIVELNELYSVIEILGYKQMPQELYEKRLKSVDVEKKILNGSQKNKK
ncbi:MAG: hypothetical protein KDC92_03485 [Bacteroidetes bacterium]|nr:hypothetical protein [Bacteroidota bacterium]